MIYVKTGTWYVGANHIILVKDDPSKDGTPRAEVIYGFTEYVKSYTVNNTTAAELTYEETMRVSVGKDIIRPEVLRRLEFPQTESTQVLEA